MSNSQHAAIFAGKRVEWYDPDAGATAPPGSCFYRIGGGIDYDDAHDFDFAELLERFLADPCVHPVVGLVIGAWGFESTDDSGPVVAALIEASERLPHLRALFLADVIQEETEISWIGHAGLTPLFSGTRLPKLRYLGLRNASGADGLVRRLVGSAILRQIRVLDLSLGDLGDAGLDALLADADAVGKLERLDLHHHYLTDAGVARARSLGVPVDVGDQHPIDDEDYRYIAHSE